jgi:hypothetical protein
MDYLIFGLSSKLRAAKPTKVMSVIILITIITFGIYHLGKDCVNYDKRHDANSEIDK